MKFIQRLWKQRCASWLVLVVCATLTVCARADQQIYTDSLQNGWANFSWAANNFTNTTPVHSGSNSISVNAGPFDAIEFAHSAQNSSPFTRFSFWVNGGSAGGQTLRVYARTNGVSLPAVFLPTLAASAWQQVSLPLASLGVERVTNLTQLNIENAASSPAATFYLDDVSLISDTTPPVVQNISPAAGTVTSLTSVTVTFSEPVLGVGASDLLLNSGPATGLIGSGATYTFTFEQPPEGVINVSWAAAHGITDLGDPANAFAATAPGATWQYTYVDTVAPVITQLFPGGGAMIAALGQIEVTFSETVLGVNASDLLINGSPATNVIKIPGQPYVFQFPPPATGLVSVAWSPAHGITDAAVATNAFAGGAWNYTLNPNLPAPDLVINEILCDNIAPNGLADEDGELQGWIEIYNRGTQPANLANWSLSDSPQIPGLWPFPARTLNPGEYLIVFASGKNRAPGVGELHTNFKLSANGEPLGLYSPDSPRKLVSGFIPFPEQRNDISYGRDLYDQLRYFATPTPGAANGFSTIVGVVAPVQVSVSRGHFTTPFTLTASCPTPAAVLRYTTDGAEPIGESALLPASLQISNTTLFRVAAFKTNYLPSKTTTHTYFFNLPEGFRTLPACSIVTATNNLFGPSGILGIHGGYFNSNNLYAWTSNAPGDYHNPSQRGVAWERPASVEWIEPTNNAGFQVDCGLRVHGSDFQRPRQTPEDKFSFGLFFRGDYGAGRLNYPLFSRTSVTRFDQIVLRAGFSEKENPFIRDELHRRLSQDMGGIASPGNLAIVFVNGVYYTNEFRPWYNPCERVGEQFLHEHLGGGDKWDVVGPAWISFGVTDGDRVDFNNLANYVNTQPVTNSSVYTNIARWLDLTNFADYCILNAYAAMGDWPGNNWHAGKDRSTTGPWRFIVWDAENGMGNRGRSITLNSFTMSGSGDSDGGLASVNASEVALLYDRLRASPEFRLLWADRIQKHFFNGGALTSASITNRFMEMRNQLFPVMGEMDVVLLEWARDRQPIFFSQMQPYGLTAYTNAPGFNQFGGTIAPDFTLIITNTGGAIYYTTNGSDPRTAFTGAVAPAAQLYSGPVTLNSNTLVRARTFSGGSWSAVTEATFASGSLGIPLRITEIMYNPVGGSLYEFVELQNLSGVTLNLGGFYFSGINFIFPQGSAIAGGARIVLAANIDTNAWAVRYPGVSPAGWFTGNLNNTGDRIALLDPLGNLITSVDYQNSAGWPTAAGVAGRSLEVINALGDPDAPANWQASASTNGTPGAANSAPPAQPVYLNELMAENFSAVNNSGTFPDWIELRNPGINPVNLAGWSLSDDGNARKFIFPTTTIAANGYLTVWCDATTNTTPGLHTGFSLNSGGETISFYDAATNRIDAFTFGLQLTNYSVGRIGGNWTLTTPTPNAANVAAPLAAVTNLALNEWLANSAPGLPDWLELYNQSATAPVALQGIYLTTSNAVHQVTSLSFIAPHGYVQLFADEGVGANHLDFKLSAIGETLTLATVAGSTIQSVAFGPQVENISEGRFPDGSGGVTNFIGSVSPAAANYLNTYAGPGINEVLARNRSTLIGTQIVDFVEIRNPSGSSFNLGGMSLGVNSQQSVRFVFPAGTTIAGGGYLVIKCDVLSPASTNAGAFNTGESLNNESGGVYLFNSQGQVVNFVEYGPQVDDLPIGLNGGQWQLLSAATPGAANAAPAVLGTNTALRLNEWMAKPATGSDWFELFNTANFAVDLSTVSLSDDPSLAGQGLFRPAPLSFIGPAGFVQWFASGRASNGRNHVNFKLAETGGTLLVYRVDSGTNFTPVDSVGFGLQTQDVSEGRFRDGGADIIAFPGTASPGMSNYRPLTNIIISEALAHTDPPLEDAVELFNPTASPVSITGWYLSNTRDDLRKYQITNTAPIPAGGYAVIYEYQFNNGTSNAFTLNSAHGDSVCLTTATNGIATGERAAVDFGASLNGVSFGRYVKSTGDADFVAMAARTFGNDSPATLAQFRTGSGLSNTYPVVGPLVISEIHYAPPPVIAAGVTNDNTLDEFIELTSVTNGLLRLYDPAYPTNRWRLSGAIDFIFPTNSSLTATGSLLVVSFDPKTNLVQLGTFRTNYHVATNVPIFGPYLGRLGNVSDTLQLERPDAVQLPPHPDAGFVPFVLVEKVAYEITNGWPANAAGNGNSIQRRSLTSYANDPINWFAFIPTAGQTFMPSLTITSPTNGQRWSNTVFTITGTARDNIASGQINNVAYQLNGAGWNSAVTANGWTNWTAAVILLPGTNIVQAYAQDMAGSVSPTNTVRFVCVITNRLALVTNGLGTVSPYPNNAWLELGRNYTNTATAAAGYKFQNWVTLTNGTAAATNTNPTLTFFMRSNLTLVANFMDTNRPTVAISSPTAGQFWSNITFTARGTAADNARVAGVWYQLNGAGWNAATTTNNWTNWTAALTLQGGANLLQAYAADLTGNLSATGAVSFIRIVTDTLRVQSVGQGTLSPNYSNAVLEIGRSYSMTATAVNGHKFASWIVATNWTDGVMKTNASLSFVMQSNLTLQVNFADTNLPVLAIISPTSGQRWSNEVFSIRGTARDNVRITNVSYQLNGGDWTAVTTTNVWTNWTAAVTLLPGTNAVRAFAEDAAGNRSATNAASLQFVVTNQLLVTAVGQGTLSPNYSNAVLEIGRSYNMTATAVNGHKFASWIVATNWTDGIVKTNASLSFIMQSNLTLQVNFADTNLPVLAITSPTSGQRWSNEVFSIRGTARDNVRITNVSYQLNGGDWTAVTTTNTWTNWTAAVTLLPGTNAVRAFAEDAAGNRSATNAASLQFVVTNQLLVTATGQGTLSPNYSNAVLEIGRSYNMTATAVNGHKFASWIVATNWTDGVVKTNASLSFVMQSNLTLRVNFADTNLPVLAITSPTSGQRWSNEVFSIRGTARDNVRITNVSYQLNGGDWTAVTTTNVWTNWTAAVTLLPGTNAVRAFAEDAAGNRSATNAASLQFVVTNQLLVTATGQGTLSPNYSNAVLEIGRSYNMAATAVNGHKFVSWIVATNWTDGVVKTNASLSFIMQSNLTLQVNFADTNLPVLAITSPTSGQRWSNEVFSIRGTARDNVRITNVSYQLNGGDWTAVTTTNAWTNWTAAVMLLPGTNAVRAFAEDAAGNRSATNAASLQFVVTVPITVQTNGNGTVSPNYNGQLLEIGRAYSMTATAGSGFVFSNWSGSASSATPTLAFLMQSNLVLQANFITNPFIPAKGIYNGLFYETNGVVFSSSGFFTATTLDNGGYSGNLSLAGQSLPFTGQMRVDGSATNTVSRAGTNSLTLTLKWNLTDRKTMAGHVTDGRWVAELAANRSSFNATTSPAPQAGSYDMILPGSSDSVSQPGGDGYATIAISTAGQVTLNGKLADNTSMSQVTTLSDDGQWPFYQALYSGKGLALGWLNVASNSLTGEVCWIKLAQAATYYPGGFVYQTNILGSRYTPPSPGQRVLNFSTGQVWLANGNLSQSFTNQIGLTTSNTVTNFSTNALTFTISTNSGSFSGSATDPVTHKVFSFGGVILQNSNIGGGFFLGTNRSGRVFIGP